MLLPFNSEFKNDPFIEDDSVRLTGYTFRELIKFTGYPGVDKIFNGTKHEFGGSYPRLFIRNSNPHLITLTLIDLENRHIKNLIVNSLIKHKGIGFKIVNYQIKLLRSEAPNESSIEKVFAFANGELKTKENVNGYITCGRLGFLMYETDDLQYFKEVTLKYNRSEERLDQLLFTKRGLEIWTNEGKPWDGVFYIKDNLSFNILKKFENTFSI